MTNPSHRRARSPKERFRRRQHSGLPYDGIVALMTAMPNVDRVPGTDDLSIQVQRPRHDPARPLMIEADRRTVGRVEMS